MAKNYSHSIADAIRNFFITENWNFKDIDERGVFRTGHTLKSKAKNAQIYINVNSTSFSIVSIFPISADEKSLDAIAEFITRANYGTIHGNFEMDYNDGEIRYKTSMYCGEQLPTNDQIGSLLAFNILTLDKYGDALIKVNFGMLNPKEAIDEVEN